MAAIKQDIESLLGLVDPVIAFLQVNQETIRVLEVNVTFLTNPEVMDPDLEWVQELQTSLHGISNFLDGILVMQDRIVNSVSKLVEETMKNVANDSKLVDASKQIAELREGAKEGAK